jgi:hypothetical protein
MLFRSNEQQRVNIVRFWIYSQIRQSSKEMGRLDPLRKVVG